jgi:hypothetical protein
VTVMLGEPGTFSRWHLRASWIDSSQDHGRLSLDHALSGILHASFGHIPVDVTDSRKTVMASVRDDGQFLDNAVVVP